MSIINHTIKISKINVFNITKSMETCNFIVVDELVKQKDFDKSIKGTRYFFTNF